MNILTNGSSVSRGPESWPYLLAEKINPNSTLTNLAQAGAGNVYIHESTVTEVAQRSYDLVMIMWSYADRWDFRAKDISQFSDTIYTSANQPNDWPSKNLIDTQHIEKNWVFGCGYLNERKDDSVGQVVAEYYNSVDPESQIISMLIRMISLQNTLTALKIPYVFMQYRPMLRIKKFNHLYKLINWDNFYTDNTLYHIAREKNAFDDTLHPSSECHAVYADHLYKFLATEQYKL
jgi:hypothetical protein